MTRPPTAVLMLLSCVIPMSPWPGFTVVTGTWIGHPESPFADRMALFEHVLMNDTRWLPVLKQRIKLSVLSLPRYRMTESYNDVLKRVQLVDPNDKEDPEVLDVIKELMDKTPWSGTNVNFTAYALSTGVTCFTYNNVSFVLSLIVNRIGMLTRKMMGNNDDDGKGKNKVDENVDGNSSDSKVGESSDKPLDKVDDAMDDVRMMFAVLVDKVAAVQGELSFFATGLYDYDGAKNKDDDLILLRMLELIKQEVDIRLERNCHPTPHTEIYQYLGEYESLNNSPTPPEELAPNDETLENELIEFEKIIDCMIDVYDGLGVETMPMETWLPIIDYRIPISMNIKFYINNVLKVQSDETGSDRLKSVTNQEKKEGKKKKKKKSKKKKEKKRRYK
ncbi:uncharacterized protein LOC100572792 [Acyrthosiphon pisum]|uniref:Uncharacterized protein n=1 Tax=Acyrthosiphon pisum TaxID=7029 RepID=A0A8R2A9K2_ACYPI|nr:uncharacterized protein LOC100572792 [Acyrthosiphon pisum]|eukprot:XP_003242025.1 PREDICTED: uncharacterized protein LOC100572792 [Acyrthosiphon pisum]